MTRLPQPARDRAADHPAPPGHHDPQAPGWRAVLLRALGSGAVASIISTLVVSAHSRWRSGSVPAGTNAASQWVWDWPARHASGWSARHTLLGYAIHHASSLLWAGGYEAWGHRRPADPPLLRAAGIAALAYVVDYHVVPRQLSPGFENRIGASGVAAAYAGFALGLALCDLVKARRHGSAPARAQRRAELVQPRQHAQRQRRQQQRQP
ncbi:hypothetical protein [Pseudoxanthomonas sp. SGNA-20]|uniref:hypothetical protein n=1 Tax=Pseudoxanthomonas sp. SGNA-20 TaxID=2493088 RepID=UPI0018F60BB2|nr:hypothetical protein [Pseudoxanthomonas sp. SGNA-20]